MMNGGEQLIRSFHGQCLEIAISRLATIVAWTFRDKD